MATPITSITRSRPRRDRQARNELGEALRELDPNLRLIVTDDLLNKHPLEKTIRRLGRGRAWLQHVQTILNCWPGLRYTTRFFISTVGVEIRAQHSTVSLIDHTFRKFELHLQEVDKLPYDGPGDPVAEYLLTREAYRTFVDHMTAAVRYVWTVECTVRASTWTIDQGPFDPWRKAFPGQLLCSVRGEFSVPAADEEIRRKFMMTAELDFYHGRYRDEVNG